MTNESESWYKNLYYVTFQDVWRELWGAFLAWVFITLLFMVGAIFVEAGVEKIKAVPEIPPQLILFLGFAVFTWVARGDSFTLTMPESTKIWLGLNASVLLFVCLAIIVQPGILLIPIYTGIVFSLMALESLVNIGRKNKEKLAQGVERGA